MKDEEESTIFFLSLIKVLLHVQGTGLFDFNLIFSFFSFFFFEGEGFEVRAIIFYNSKKVYQTYQYMT